MSFTRTWCHQEPIPVHPKGPATRDRGPPQIANFTKNDLNYKFENLSWERLLRS